MGFQLVNFTPGPKTPADYTDPEMENYINSEEIMQTVWQAEFKDPNGLNGYIILFHIGVGDKRTDKFYKLLPDLIKGLQKSGYEIVGLNELLEKN